MFSRFIAIFYLCTLFTVSSNASEHVILLHGLCRGPRSMKTMERKLTDAGYQVLNMAYPSRSGSVKQLSDKYIGKAVEQCEKQGSTRIHFVTHSMGGILIRAYLKSHKVAHLGKVVMLAPPNQGSEVVDRLGHWRLFQYIHGPAGGELGTGKNSTPSSLGEVNFHLGVIAGNCSINWINSLMIKGRDDGKVSIQHTKVQGMTDHIVVKTNHPYIMNNKTVGLQTLAFLRNGHFQKSSKTSE